MGDALYKASHKASGLCQDCPQKAEIRGYCVKHYWRKVQSERKYVREHAVKKHDYWNNLRQERINNRLCDHCGIPLLEEEGRRCVNCNAAAH